MRVTRERKQQTQSRLLDVGRDLFTSIGYDRATTRDIARGAGVATGTVFNYFPTKEALALALIGEALAGVEALYEMRRHGKESLEEDLFAFVMANLRRLEPYREFAPAILDATWRPVGSSSPLRTVHLETVSHILTRHGFEDPLSFAAAHLYWSLLNGIFSFWAIDDSPHQEDTLALLDQAVHMYVAWFRSARSAEAPFEEEGGFGPGTN